VEGVAARAAAEGVAARAAAAASFRASSSAAAAAAAAVAAAAARRRRREDDAEQDSDARGSDDIKLDVECAVGSGGDTEACFLLVDRYRVGRQDTLQSTNSS
jgi:hypothetical protein